jgi:hypothetical protein
MKVRHLMAAACALSFPFAALAAETLYTGTLWAVAPDRFACNLTNVGARARKVEVRIVSQGKVIAETGVVTLAPRHTTDKFVDGHPDGAPFFCEFVVEGAKTQYRGSAKVFHPKNSAAGTNETDFVALPAF